MKLSKVTSGRKPTFLLQVDQNRMSDVCHCQRRDCRKDRGNRRDGSPIRKGSRSSTCSCWERAGAGFCAFLLIGLPVEHGSGELRADRPHGVSHADCEFISQQVGTILDIEDVIPGDSYTLEVSSPGLERKLSKAKDFERFVGQKAKVSAAGAGGKPASLGRQAGRYLRGYRRAGASRRKSHPLPAGSGPKSQPEV